MPLDVSFASKLGLDLEAFKKWNARRSFKGEARARVYRKIATFLRNGVPLPDALRIIMGHASDDGRKPDAPVAVVMRSWLRQIDNGRSLGMAVTDWVPDSDRIVIEAGDRAGELAQALDDALFIAESSRKIRGAIVGGLMYPILLMCVAIGLILMFGIDIVPKYEDVFPREKWEGGAAALSFIADLANYWLLPALVAMAAAGAVMAYSMPRWVGKSRVKFDRIPPWSLYRLVRGSGFMLSVSSLIKAGVQVPEILRILRKGASPWYDERIHGALRYVQNGDSLGEALYKTGLEFPEKEAVMDLRAFSAMDGFEEKLNKMGRDWVTDSVQKVQGQMATVRTMSIVMLAFIFGAIAVGSMSINQQMMAQANTSTPN